MYKSITHVFMLAFLMLMGCASNRQTDVASLSQMPILVYGMGCPLCSTNAIKQLMKIDGIVDVNINLDDGVTTIYYQEDVTPSDADITAAIKNSGFTLQAIRPSSEAIAAYRTAKDKEAEGDNE